MDSALPAAVAAYLATPTARIAADVDRLFAPDAVVHDDGHDHVGADAIRTWSDRVGTAFTVDRTVTGSRTVGPATIVTVHLRGDFPGSPVDLHHHFTLDGDRIGALTICT